MGRPTGVDVISGDGLDEALAGVDCIVDTATGPSPEQEAVTKFCGPRKPRETDRS